jgi:hypothetical protein
MRQSYAREWLRMSPADSVRFLKPLLPDKFGRRERSGLKGAPRAPSCLPEPPQEVSFDAINFC